MATKRTTSRKPKRTSKSAPGRKAAGRSQPETAASLMKKLDALQREVEALRASVKAMNGTAVEKTMLQRWEEAGLVGVVKDAPPDLSTNKKYMEGFGES
jgi:uncharacterized protein YlxW (UPF0749 family)